MHSCDCNSDGLGGVTYLIENPSQGHLYYTLEATGLLTFKGFSDMVYIFITFSYRRGKRKLSNYGEIVSLLLTRSVTQILLEFREHSPFLPSIATVAILLFG